MRRAWQAAGRTGRPKLVAQLNAALGPNPTIEEARGHIRRYYSGPDEIIFYCWSPDTAQIDRFADALA